MHTTIARALNLQFGECSTRRMVLAVRPSAGSAEHVHWSVALVTYMLASTSQNLRSQALHWTGASMQA